MNRVPIFYFWATRTKVDYRIDGSIASAGMVRDYMKFAERSKINIVKG